MSIICVTKKSIPVDPQKLTCIYGAGDLGSGVGNVIGVRIKEYFYTVDDQYINAEFVEDKWGGHRLRRLSEVLQDDSVNLFWGIGSYNELNKFLKGKIEKDIYLLFSTFSLWEWDQHLFDRNRNKYDRAKNILVDKLSQNIFDAFLEAHKTGLADDDIKFGSLEDTYFNSLTKDIPDGAYVDCGAFNGDSAAEFLQFAGDSRRKVIAFEPDADNFKALSKRGFENADYINQGVWDCSTRLSFSGGDAQGSHLSEDGDQTVAVTSIDETVHEKVAFIKMDVEGSELKALEGARHTIERDLPILTISAYHRQTDLFELVEEIHSFCEGKAYALYLRHHAPCDTELVLYGIPRK